MAKVSLNQVACRTIAIPVIAAFLSAFLAAGDAGAQAGSNGTVQWSAAQPRDVYIASGPTAPPGMSQGYSTGMLDYEVVVPGVPAYLWCHGCGPTSAGMVIGYWDGRGFDDLVPGDASTQTPEVNQMMASTGNYNDYCLPIDLYPNFLGDKSEPPPGDEHPDDCVADFMKTSQSAAGCTYGGSWTSNMPVGLSKYPEWANPRYKVASQNYSWGSFDWQAFRDEIDAGRPMVFTVDTDGNQESDHFVTVLGYGELNGVPMYGCYHNFDTEIHWYEFGPAGIGKIFGIYIMTDFSLSCDAVTIHVPDDHPTIQEAVAAAVDGDTVVVRAGTYAENIDFMGKAVTLKSESGPAATVIDGGNPVDPDKASCVQFVSGEGRDSVLEGFTLTNGRGSFHDGYVARGGGVFCNMAAPTIRGNVITGNTAYYGGGIGLKWFGDALIENNRIEANTAELGGGIDCDWYSEPEIAGNTIARNAAALNGGGVTSQWGSVPVFRFTVLRENTATWGGGVSTGWDAEAVFESCEIAGNQASENGGGVYSHSAGVDVSLRFESCIVAGNSAPIGAGFDFEHDANFSINGCTFFGNAASVKGGGLACRKESSAVIANTILWNNSALSEGKEIWIGTSTNPSTVTISDCDLEGGQSSVFVKPGCTLNWGSGMIDVDPLFAASSRRDYHLTWTSPCRDAGNNASAAGLLDFEGDPRIADGTVDMGADEFHLHLYHVGAVAPGGSIDLKVAGTPGASPVKLALGSGIQDPPQTTPYGDLYLVLPPVLVIDLGAIPSNGVLVKTAAVPSIWSPGEEKPFQALVGPMAPGSVLTNLLVLTVE